MYPSVRSFVLRNGGNDHDALDVFQEAVVILYNHIKEDRLKQASTISSYLYSVSKNLWLQSLRKWKKYEVTDNFQSDNVVELTDVDKQGLSIAKIMGTLLEKLDAPCREILKLYYYQNKSMNEIMSYFSLSSEQAAKNKKFRCLRKLENLFKAYNIKRDNFTG